MARPLRRFAGSTMAAIGLAASLTPVLGWSSAAGAATVQVDATVLRIYLSGAGGESVAVTCSGGFAAVNGTATSLHCDNGPGVFGMTSVQVNGSPGPDTIDLTGATQAEFPRLTQVSANGDGGNDTITAAADDTTLSGGSGNDTVTGGPGADYLQGEAGNDVLVGAAGNDVILPGPGADTVDAGDDDDTIWSVWPDGQDASVDAGAGTDDFFRIGSSLDDRVVVSPRVDGGLDLVNTMPTAADVFVVPPSFELLRLSTNGGADLIEVDALSPSIAVDVAGATSTARLEVLGHGPVTVAAGQISAAGFAPVTFSGLASSAGLGAFPSTNHSFVHAASHDLSGTHLSSGQIATVAAKISAGTLTRSAYAQQLVGTSAWREAEAERIFRAYLRRGLDASGRSYYAEKIRTGTKLNQIRATVIGSSEYYRNRGYSNVSQFVDAVYFDVLHRLPDASGKAYWVNRINGGESRTAIATSLLGTTQPVKEFIRYHYRDLLGRDPSTGEIDTWLTAVRDTALGERSLQTTLVASSAYLVRWS